MVNIIKTYFYQQPIYYSYHKKLNIQKNIVLIESTHGRNISGHLFYLTKELCTNFPELNIYVVAQNVKEIEIFLSENNINNVQVVKHLSRKYLRLLASAEYLLNDTTFYSFFTKKKGQRYINIWHGTPLKTLGKDVENITDVANVQRNFYMADKIITSNDYTQNILASSHGLNGVYQGKMVIAPSPRNAILLDKQKREEIRQKLHMHNKKLSFYMPTWRGSIGKVKDMNNKIMEDLRYLSENMNEEDRFFVKLHPFQKDIDLSEFNNVFPMPAEYELYEFLTAVDVLITDYSSIMYDFLLADKKIILYIYDKEEYSSTRGVYDNIDRYPFKQVETVEQLVQEIQKSDTTIEYTEMKEEFCPYDSINGVAVVCDYIFHNQQHETIKETNLYNGKETAIILGGGFWDNGVTTALLNTFDNIDLNKRNYIVLLGQNQLKREYMFRIKNLPKEILFYPIPETINAGMLDRLLYFGQLKFSWFQSSWINKRIGEVVKNDFYRITGDLKIDHFIHYTGFGSRYAELIKHVPSETNTVMFVHTDMMKEYEAKKNFNLPIIFSAYESVSKVALVHSNLKSDLIKKLPTIEDKLYVVNNFLGEERIRKLASNNLYDTLLPTKVEYAFERELSEAKLPNLYPHVNNDIASIKELGVQKARLLNDLLNGDMTCFINIGRYDYQKGHDRLITAFERVYSDNTNTRLIIVAPHGPLREQTIRLAKESAAREGIFILGRMGNPYPLLKCCNAFVLSSHYEGLGLVVYEALAVGTTAITVDITETIQYLQEGEAIVVDNSEEGIYQGMLQYLNDGDTQNKFDFSIPKQKSLAEFERLFEEA